MCKLTPQSKGYLTVTVNRKLRLVSNLVLEAFEGPKPEGAEACHYPDSTKTNNRVTNLRWGTSTDNAQDRVLHCRVPQQQLTPEDVVRIKQQVDDNPLTRKLREDIQKEFPKATDSMLKHIKYGHCWEWLDGRLKQ